MRRLGSEGASTLVFEAEGGGRIELGILKSPFLEALAREIPQDGGIRLELSVAGLELNGGPALAIRALEGPFAGQQGLLTR